MKPTILILWVLVTASALAQNVGYRNDNLGESYKTYLVNNPPKPNKDPGGAMDDIFNSMGGCDNDTDDRLCQQLSNGSGPALIAYHFVSDVLKSIDGTFDRSMYTSIVEAITAKYGKPTKSESINYTMTNGGQLPVQVVMWHRSGATITVSEWRNGADLRRNVGSFLITDDAYAEQQKPHVSF